MTLSAVGGLVGIHARESGVENGVLGLFQRGIRKGDRVIGVRLVVLGANLEALGVEIGLLLGGVLAHPSDVALPVLLQVGPALLGAHGGVPGGRA